MKNRAVWWCGRDDVVWMLCFTFLGRVVCGVVGWGGGGYRVNGVVWSFSGMQCGRCGLVEVCVR